MIQVNCALSDLVTMKTLLHSCQIRDYKVNMDNTSQDALCYIEVKADNVLIGLLEDAYLKIESSIFTIYGWFGDTDKGRELLVKRMEIYKAGKNPQRQRISEYLSERK